jgi:glycerol-3-phosphate acyltransferase PlsY
MAVVAIAPIVGHAFSPFLRFRGGKAVATTFGTWCGLTVWEGPTILGLGLFMTTRRWRADGWVVLFSMIILLAWLLLTPPSWNGLGLRPPIPLILAVWIPNTALLIWKYRADFSHPPLLRSQPLPKP